MVDFWIAVALSLLSAVCYGAGAASQRLVAARMGRPLTVRVVLTVLTRDRLWWVALLLNGLGAVLHVVALVFGALIVVQPLGLLALVFALPWAARFAVRPVSRREAEAWIDLTRAAMVTRQRDLEFSDVIRRRCPLMHEAILQVGDFGVYPVPERQEPKKVEQYGPGEYARLAAEGWRAPIPTFFCKGNNEDYEALEEPLDGTR